MKYGKTWWGAKWLDALNGIDFTNRLSRGKTYANTGKVFDFKIDKNKVTAKVKGNFKSHYVVDISFNSFSKKEKDLIVSTIYKYPSLLSSLLNNELPEDLYYILENEGIDLFPKSSKDMSANCNCPDYASICKHIAGVVYILANEIDRDPFQVFKLHDCDLLDLLDYGENKDSIKYLDDVLTLDYDISKKEAKTLDSIDFSNINDSLNNIFLLLDDDPVFYQRNFKNILLTNYKSFKRFVNKNLKNILNYTNGYYGDISLEEDFIEFFGDKEDFDTWAEDIFLQRWDKPNRWDKFHININKDYKISSINTGVDNPFKKESYEEFLLAFFNELNYSSPLKYNYDIQFLNLIYQFSISLINNFAFIPELFKTPNGLFNIRWIPPIFDRNVYSVFEDLVLLCPGNLISYKGKKISKANQVIIGVSLFINEFFHYAYDYGFNKSMDGEKTNSVYKLFFFGPQSFGSSEYKGYESLINQWLSKFSFNLRDYDLFLVIDEQYDGFSVSINVGIDGKVPENIGDVLSKAEGDLKLQLLKDTYLISDLLPEVGEGIILGDDIEFNLEEFSSFFVNALPLFEIAGINIILPKSLRNVFKPKLNLDIKKPGNVKGYLTLDDLSDFDWRIAIGDNFCSPEEFKSLVSDSEGLVKIANSYVILNKDEVKSLIKDIDKLPSKLNRSELMQAILSGELNGAEVSADDEFNELIKNITNVDAVKVPSSLNASLRPYQVTGFSWLVQNIKTGFGSILADDMGLGKTIQVLTTILYFKEEGLLDDEKVLVIAPTSLLSNWQSEIKRFTPSLKSVIYHGNKRTFPKEDFDILLTSYGVIRRDKDKFKLKKWFLSVIDEAQNIKNPVSKQSKAVKSVKSKYRVALSGTPVENRLLEYWSIFDFVNKGYLHSIKKFKKEYIVPIEKYREGNVLNNFKLITSPFILRRLKTDKSIIKDLPDKTVNDVYCNLTAKQSALYKKNLDSLFKDLYEKEGIDRKGIIFKIITTLKEICNHPSQFTKSKTYSVDESGKMEALMSILDNIIESGEKTLIFTQYVHMGNIMKDLIEKEFDIEVLFLHGSLSRKKRDEMVNKFQNNDQSKIFILSLKAGGTGLNLTAAQNVIHYDLWWNPAVENQATDRAYRIGQKKNVMVYRLVTSGTFEEKINMMIDEKQELAELTVGSGETFVSEMSDSELRNILKLRN